MAIYAIQSYQKVEFVEYLNTSFEKRNKVWDMIFFLNVFI